MSMHVVHIEDEKPLKEILRIALQSAEPGIKMQQFIRGEEALPYIETNAASIDLYIIDIRLPGTMDGIEIARRIRELNAPGYIVMTSAYSRPSTELLTSLRLEFYPKPWHLADITQKLLRYRVNIEKNTL